MKTQFKLSSVYGYSTFLSKIISLSIVSLIMLIIGIILYSNSKASSLIILAISLSLLLFMVVLLLLTYIRFHKYKRGSIKEITIIKNNLNETKGFINDKEMKILTLHNRDNFLLKVGACYKVYIDESSSSNNVILYHY